MSPGDIILAFVAAGVVGAIIYFLVERREFTALKNKLRHTAEKQEQSEQDKAAVELRRKTPPKVTVTPSRWKNRISISIRSLNGIALNYNWYVAKYSQRWNGYPLTKMADSFTPDESGQGITVGVDLETKLRSVMVEELVLDFACESANLKEIPLSEQNQHRKRCVFRLRWHQYNTDKIEIFTEDGKPVESLEALTQAEHKAINPPKTVPIKLP